MFDTKKVANNIKNARVKLNITQVNLADELGVSYQAVSNWERGNSMPDISRLKELCEALKISFEELVGERSSETETVEKLMSGEGKEVSLDEMAKVVPLITPDKIDDKIDETIDEGGLISMETLLNLAPFMEDEELAKMTEKLKDFDIKKLVGLGPFLDEEILHRIIRRAIKDNKIEAFDMTSLSSLAPFAGEEALDELIVKAIDEEWIDENVSCLAPFINEKTVRKIVDYFVAHGRSQEIIALAPFM